MRRLLSKIRIDGRIRILLRDTRASEIAETAVVLPLLFVFLLGIFWFGQAFRIYGNVTQAARQGARAAVAPACATCAPINTAQSVTNAVNAVTNTMNSANLSTAQLQNWSSWTRPALCACGTQSGPCGATVSCQPVLTNVNVCVQTNVQLSYPAQGGAGVCGTSVSLRYKYPFGFTLPCYPQPCNSLDLSQIMLPGQAQMRVETQ